MSILLDGDARSRALFGRCNASMERAVEPVIRQAMVDLETVIRREITEPLIRNTLEAAEYEMRQQMAVILISAIDSAYDMERNGDTLRVMVRHDKRNGR